MSQLKVLIIDDDADQRDLTREVLEDRFGRGCVAEAGTGTEALAKDLASFDMILSDYNLPDCSGIDLLTQIRARCQTPVIMVTGENVSELAAEAIRRGATDYVVKVGDYFFTIPLIVEKNLTVAKLKRENEQLQSDLKRSLDETSQKNQQLNDALARVEELAATDALTGLYNRRHFASVFDQLYAESGRYGSDLTVAMIDLDGYKQLNDTLGHQMGDQILVLVGRLLRETMRRADVAARYGGDEFVLMLPRSDAAEATQVVNRIREEFVRRSNALIETAPIVNPAGAAGKRLGLTMSVGIASVSGTRPTSADELLAAADAALYRSKASGRDRVTIATPAEVEVRRAS